MQENRATAVDTILNFQNVNSAVVDFLIETIRAIRARGSEAVNRWLRTPLRARYEKSLSLDQKELQSTLQFFRTSRQFKKMGIMHGKLLQHAAWESEARVLMTALSNLLLDLEKFPEFRETLFAREFMQILREPFYDFQKQNFGAVEAEFTRELENRAALEKDLPRPAAASAQNREKLDREAEILFQKIERAFVMNDQNKLTYHLAQFTGRFCNVPEVRHRGDVDRILEDLTARNPEFRREVNARLSIKLYRQIIQSAAAGDLKKAIRAISTYALTFGQNMDVPYRRELDAFEEKLYAYIARHDLWDKLRADAG